MEDTREASFEAFENPFAEHDYEVPQAVPWFSPALYQDVSKKRTVAEEAVPPSDTMIPCKQSKITENAELEARKMIYFFTMLRRCMLYYFARCCTDRLFKDPNKWTLDGDDVVLTLRFCEGCAKGNLAVASAYLKYFISREAVEAGKSLPKKEKLSGLWRLFRLKYTLAIHPCQKCADRIRDSCVVHKDENGDTVVRYRMCKRCARGHMEMTQLYNDNFVPQTEDDD